MVQHMFKLNQGNIIFFVIALFNIKDINLNYVFLLIICDVMRFYICYNYLCSCIL